MKGLARKAVIKYKASETRVSRSALNARLAGRGHRHVCRNSDCRLAYEDNCQTPADNDLCEPCRGRRRTWTHHGGLFWLDPSECCLDNTEVMTNVDDLLRYQCAGPGPWFQCRTCKRTHGHPCTEEHLLLRPYEVQEGT